MPRRPDPRWLSAAHPRQSPRYRSGHWLLHRQVQPSRRQSSDHRRPQHDCPWLRLAATAQARRHRGRGRCPETAPSPGTVRLGSAQPNHPLPSRSGVAQGGRIRECRRNVDARWRAVRGVCPRPFGEPLVAGAPGPVGLQSARCIRQSRRLGGEHSRDAQRVVRAGRADDVDPWRSSRRPARADERAPWHSRRTVRTAVVPDLRATVIRTTAARGRVSRAATRA